MAKGLSFLWVTGMWFVFIFVWLVLSNNHCFKLVHYHFILRLALSLPTLFPSPPFLPPTPVPSARQRQGNLSQIKKSNLFTFRWKPFRVGFEVRAPSSHVTLDASVWSPSPVPVSASASLLYAIIDLMFLLTLFPLLEILFFILLQSSQTDGICPGKRLLEPTLCCVSLFFLFVAP